MTSKPTTFGIAKQYKRKDSEAPVDAAVTTSSPSNTPPSEQTLFDSNTENGVSDLSQFILQSYTTALKLN